MRLKITTRTPFIFASFIAALSFSASSADAGFKWVPATQKAEPSYQMVKPQIQKPVQRQTNVQVQPYTMVPQHTAPVARPAPTQQQRVAAVQVMSDAPAQPMMVPAQATPTSLIPAPPIVSRRQSYDVATTANNMPTFEVRNVSERRVLGTEFEMTPMAPPTLPRVGNNIQSNMGEMRVAQAAPSRTLLIDPNPLGNRSQTASFNPAQNAAPSFNSHNFNVIDGFGTEIPLALALSQIIPADYAYSFRGTVNPGVKVSWAGGQPWNIVLAGILENLGMKAVITNNTIIISQEMALLEKFEDAIPLHDFGPQNIASLQTQPQTQTALVIKPFPDASDLNTVSNTSNLQIAGSGLKKKLRLMA